MEKLVELPNVLSVLDSHHEINGETACHSLSAGDDLALINPRGFPKLPALSKVKVKVCSNRMLNPIAWISYARACQMLQLCAPPLEYSKGPGLGFDRLRGRPE